MKINVFYLILFSISVIGACGNNNQNTNEEGEATSMLPSSENSGAASDYDPKRGEGKYSEENLKLSDKIDDAMAESGAKIQGVKCSSCHKLGTEKLVGPGWEGVTQRRTPAWIMNFITNPDPMISKDPELQAQLELCLVRMPNQSLTDDDDK